MGRRGSAAPLMLVVVLLVLVVGLVAFYLGRRVVSMAPARGLGGIASEAISSLLPKGAFLRDYERLSGVVPESYLVMYVEPGYKMDLPPSGNPPYYMSCPEASVGQGIEGTYHLALFQDGKIKNDLVIPAEGKIGNRQVLSFRNTRGNIYGYEMVSDSEREVLEVVKFLQLKDYTGDGKAYEFDIWEPAMGCFSPARLVAGYDPDLDQAAFFSDWMVIDGSPNSKGVAHWLFDCGNHGNNQAREERTYTYDSQIKRFKLTDERSTPCEYPSPSKKD